MLLLQWSSLVPRSSNTSICACSTRVSDQLSDGLIFGRLFQANEIFLRFDLAPACRSTCVQLMNLLRCRFAMLQVNEVSVRKLQTSDDTINFRTLKLESSVDLPNSVCRYSCPSSHKTPNFGFCCALPV